VIQNDQWQTHGLFSRPSYELLPDCGDVMKINDLVGAGAAMLLAPKSGDAAEVATSRGQART
jgi:hypothetical protein